jgi:hypothetical protein
MSQPVGTLKHRHAVKSTMSAYLRPYLRTYVKGLLMSRGNCYTCGFIDGYVVSKSSKTPQVQRQELSRRIPATLNDFSFHLGRPRTGLSHFEKDNEFKYFPLSFLNSNRLQVCTLFGYHSRTYPQEFTRSCNYHRGSVISNQAMTPMGPLNIPLRKTLCGIGWCRWEGLSLLVLVTNIRP